MIPKILPDVVAIPGGGGFAPFFLGRTPVFERRVRAFRRDPPGRRSSVVGGHELLRAAAAGRRRDVGRSNGVLLLARRVGGQTLAPADGGRVGVRRLRRAGRAAHRVGRRDSGGGDPGGAARRAVAKSVAGRRTGTGSSTWARSSTSGASTGTRRRASRAAGRAGADRGGTRSAGPRRRGERACRRTTGTRTTGSAFSAKSSRRDLAVSGSADAQRDLSGDVTLLHEPVYAAAAREREKLFATGTSTFAPVSARLSRANSRTPGIPLYAVVFTPRRFRGAGSTP